MSIVILYISTVVVFLGLDVIGLRLIVKPVFDRDIGDILLDTPRYGPALVFYLFFIAGLLWFVTAPALMDGTGLGQVALSAAILGAIGYGTYEFSNLATIRGWTWQMVWTDFLWGIALTTVSACAGLLIARSVASS